MSLPKNQNLDSPLMHPHFPVVTSYIPMIKFQVNYPHDHHPKTDIPIMGSKYKDTWLQTIPSYYYDTVIAPKKQNKTNV